MLKRENIKISDGIQDLEMEENLNFDRSTDRRKKVDPVENQLFMDVRYRT